MGNGSEESDATGGDLGQRSGRRAGQGIGRVTANDVLETVAPQVQEEIREVVQEVVAEPEPAEHVSAYAQIDEVAHVEEEVTAALVEEHVAPPVAHREANVNETQEIDAFQPAESQRWENTYAAPPAEIVSQFLETPKQEFAEAEHVEESPLEAVETVAENSAEVQHMESEVVEETAHAPEAEKVADAAAQPNANMDELVARVLARMNPDVLQKVTREILKPVIEAIVQDEINSRSSKPDTQQESLTYKLGESLRRRPLHLCS